MTIEEMLNEVGLAHADYCRTGNEAYLFRASNFLHMIEEERRNDNEYPVESEFEKFFASF